VFCPNCGTQNDSAATPCKKCGFKLSGVSAPKFKGTMVLNSDQTVQELIEEHRRRQASGGSSDEVRRASEPPPPSSGSAPPSSGFPGSRGPVLQPPRVAPGASRRRMGGTMLGVAPQAGGVLPPGRAARPAPVEVPPQPPTPSHDDTARAEPSMGSAPAADPLAGTAAMPAVEEPAPPPSPSPEPPAAKLAATVVLPKGGELEAAEPAAPRAIADTAPIAQPPVAAPASSVRQPSPAGLRPLDIVLIIVTFGLYGIVLWAKQRKPEA
jgi:zinc ribbon protein